MAINMMHRMKAAIRNVLGQAGYEIFKKDPRRYDQEGLTSYHRRDFANDHKFTEAYDYAFNATKADPTHYAPSRVYIATWGAKAAPRRQGDFVKCGTARAFVSCQ